MSCKAVFIHVDSEGKMTPIEFKDGKMISLEEINSITLSVQEYAQIFGKSVSWVTKHLRNKKQLPYVLRTVKHERYNNWILTVSSSIKLKTPLK